MTKKIMSVELRLMPIAAALLAVYGNASAQTSTEVDELIKPSSSISVGVGHINNTQDAKYFGKYTGYDKGGYYGLIDFDILKRNEETGTWLNATGRDLGLDTRELGFALERQGKWKFGIDYNETVRNDPYVIHTGMTGIGTDRPTVNLIALPTLPTNWATANGMSGAAGVPGSDVSLKIKRDALGFSGGYWLSNDLQFEFSFKNEDKNGARMFGRVGYTSGDMTFNPTTGTGNANGGYAVLLTPEPIDSTTRQFEAKLNFATEKLAITGGYYGSFYVNSNGSLTPIVPETLNRGLLKNGCGVAGTCFTVGQIASSAVALPPDNQAHQLYLSGNYAFSPETRLNFKYSYTHATQDKSFAEMGLLPARTATGTSDSTAVLPVGLGGVVNTTLAQVGLSLRPTPKLSINANFRYENRDDNTDRNIYNTSTASLGLNNTTNWPSASQTRTSGKLDATYRIGGGYTAMLGADLEQIKRPLPTPSTAVFANQVFFRDTLSEYGVKADLRKSMLETLSAMVGVEYRERTGGTWYTTSGVGNNALVAYNPSSGTLATARVLPMMYMDRNRTKIKASADWSPFERLSIQGAYEQANDAFNRSGVDAGPRQMLLDSLSLDATYVLSDSWKLSGYWTRDSNRWDVNKSSINGQLDDRADTFGLGLKGKFSARLELGADLMTTRNSTSFINSNFNGTAVAGWNVATGAVTTSGGNYLPPVNYQIDQLKLYANYSVDKHSGIRADLVYQKFNSTDWLWGYNGVPFVYSDNTTVSQPMNQKLMFLGARYTYNFQ